MILSEWKLSPTQNGVRLSCEVDRDGHRRELWYSIRGVDPSKIPADRFNWALVALLVPAMKEGRDITVRGEVSARLFHFLNGDLQAVLCLYEPRFSRIHVTADRLSHSRGPATDRIGTGFSAGVDSFATLALFSGDNAPGSAVSDLCTFNMGAMGHTSEAAVQVLFQKYCDRTDRYAARTQRNSISIDSNISDFYDSSLYFQKTHTLRNVSAALTLEGNIDRYLYSSAYDLSKIGVKKTDNMAYMDPITLPMLATENMDFISSGAGLSRYQKAEIISSVESAVHELDVCAGSAEERLASRTVNCSRCWKCRRTMVILESLKILDDFSEVFDLDLYRSSRKKIYRSVIRQALRGVALDKEAISESISNKTIADLNVLDYLDYYIYRLGSGVERRMKRFLGSARRRPGVSSELS